MISKSGMLRVHTTNSKMNKNQGRHLETLINIQICEAYESNLSQIRTYSSNTNTNTKGTKSFKRDIIQKQQTLIISGNEQNNPRTEQVNSTKTRRKSRKEQHRDKGDERTNCNWTYEFPCRSRDQNPKQAETGGFNDFETSNALYL